MSGTYFGNDVADDVRLRTDIVSLISEYVKLRKAGKNYVGLCPFHEEKTPSFSVDPDKQFFYCFGCGTGGNAFTFLMKKEGLSFPEALKVLADRAGVRLPAPKMRAEERAAAAQKKRLGAALEFACGKYRDCLASNQGARAREYLEKRGIDEKLIGVFGIGYAPDEWEYISRLGSDSGLATADMLAGGLLVERESGKGFYDRFRDRIMFPIHDSMGRIVGFGGRALGDGQPKYLNSPDTALFRKGKELYALNLAKPSIRKRGAVIVMEGYMDVVSSFKHGIDYAVAGMGTALTKEQARALLLLTEKVILAYDQDEAGRRAIRRSVSVFRSAGGRTHILSLGDCKDPDEFLSAKGPEAFAEAESSVVADVAFLYDEAKKAHGTRTVSGKVRVRDEMLPVLASLESDFERSLYLEEIARDLGVAKGSLANEVETYRRNSTSKNKDVESRDTSSYDPGVGEPTVDVARRKAEEGIIRAVIEDTGLGDWAKKNLTEDDFADPKCREAIKALRLGSLGSVEDEELLSWQAGLCQRFPVDQPERILKDCLRKLREFRLSELQSKIAFLERDKDHEALLEVQSEYRSLLSQVKSVGGSGGGELPPEGPRREHR